jgi:hypothetical protein
MIVPGNAISLSLNLQLNEWTEGRMFSGGLLEQDLWKFDLDKLGEAWQPF